MDQFEARVLANQERNLTELQEFCRKTEHHRAGNRH